MQHDKDTNTCRERVSNVTQQNIIDIIIAIVHKQRETLINRGEDWRAVMVNQISQTLIVSMLQQI